MSFTNPNIYITTSGFWIRWTLVAFIFINILLLVYLIKNLKGKSITLIFTLDKSLLLPTLIYLSTIPIYMFRDTIGNGKASAIYKTAEHLNSIESLVVFVLIAVLIYGFIYKNSYTFINVYFRALADIEITYIISCYVTNQVKLDQWFNWFGVFLLGIIFVTLSKIKIKSTIANTPPINIHDAVVRYDSLFSARKYQANEIVNIITSDISEAGYSICVTGEWGTGKTSLINGVYNKAKQIDGISLYEIRINALELDDSISLINYFFIRIEEILKTNGIYTGIASEYKELLASISGTIISKNSTDFVLKKLNKGNSDYRENIKKLSKLIFDNLRKSRILIIIDDIERCSPEKAKSYLFLMKELATMNCCIAIFLADIDELKKTCTLDESFFEKFFNYTLSLVTVDFDEIISSLSEFSAEASDLCQEIKKILKQFDNSIEKAEKEPFLYIHNYQERQEYKENRIRSIKEDKERFILELSNPRRVRKVTEYYGSLILQVNQQQFNCSSEKAEAVSLFLKKVDYKKQLSLLSIIYGLYNSEFVWMQQNGIYNYIGDFSDRCKLAKSTNEKIHSLDSLIENEWCFLRQHSSDFKIQEALRFVNCVLIEIGELVNISNGYNSFEEKRISTIKSGKLPNDKSFPDLVEMIYTATYNNMQQREDFIKRVFKLFAKDIGTKAVDDSFKLFENNGIRNFFSSETPVLQIFSEIFCTDTCRLANPERIKNSFISFAQVYLWRNVTICSRYFLPVSFPERVSNETWNNASEKVLAHGNCKDMLNAYCETCESYLEFSDGKPNIDAIQRLKYIIAKVSEKYSELEMAGCLDVLQVHEDVEKLVKEITYLFEIEKFLNKCSETAEQDTFNLRGLSINDLSQSICTLHSELCEEIDYNRNHDIQGLLQFVCSNECSITQDAYEKLNSMVEKYCVKHNPIASWRQMLIYIKTRKIKD